MDYLMNLKAVIYVDPYSSTELAHKIEYCFKLDEKIVNKMRRKCQNKNCIFI